jgi:hypothetical protein
MLAVPAYVVLFLVLSPIELPAPHRVSEPYWGALKQTAWDLELTGPRCPWINDFESEVRWVRKNWREAAECPPLADSKRLPPPSLIRKLLGFNAAYRQFLEARREVRRHEWDEVTEVLGETDRLREVWQAAADASSEDHIWVCRRRALKRLKELIGEEAYDAGNLPPCVPLWRFHESSFR